jgi:hypothetical protein
VPSSRKEAVRFKREESAHIEHAVDIGDRFVDQ